MNLETCRAELDSHTDSAPDSASAVRAGVADPSDPLYRQWLDWVARKAKLVDQLNNLSAR
jgi:hypothetical protein